MSKSVKDLLKEKFGIVRPIKELNGSFYCKDNELTSLEGSPKIVNGHFDCTINNLTSLEGSPIKVNGSFYCQVNQLTSLEGAPKEVGGYFDCSLQKSNVRFTYDDVQKVCNIDRSKIITM